MNIGNILAITSIVASMVSVPFIAREIQGDYTSAGSLLLNTDVSNVEQTPKSISSSYGPNKLEKEMDTPFGRFKLSMESGRIHQELERPGRRVVVFETPDQIVWTLYTQELLLSVTRKNGSVRIENCTTPNGTIIKIKDSGTTEVTQRGVGLDGLKEKCKEAETTLKSEVERMEGMKKKMLNLPPEVVINEIVSDPKENESEWIELYNKEIFDISLSGWSLCDGSECYDFVNKNLSSRGYLMLNESVFDFSLNNDGDIIKLKKEGKLVDKVTYGNWDDGYIQDNAPKPHKGNSTGRCPNGVDTDVDNVDFAIFIIPTPGEENNCTYIP